jgi:acyl-coenzyme A synthetase/AMP-(fatty) acid ligase
VGILDHEAGEIPVAHVVLRPGVEVTPEEIQEFVAGQVAHYKQVRKVVITDVIPKSASGKILRRILRDQPPA